MNAFFLAHHPSRMAVWLLGAFLGAAGPAAAGVIPTPYEVHVLKNGLTVVLMPRAHSGLLAYDTLVRVGSRNEAEPGRSGYAHLFEHLMFRGTPTVSTTAYQAALQGHGASSNAFTQNDLTLFTLTGVATGLPQFVALEADRFQHLSYSKSAFETETKAVWGELLKQQNSPGAALEEALLGAAFMKHPYGHSILGREKDILSMAQGYDYSKEFFGRYYTPDNCAVVLVGDFVPAAALSILETAYGGWHGRSVTPRLAKEPPQSQERRVAVPWPWPAQGQLQLAWHVPASPKDAALASLLPSLLFGTTSPIYQTLVRQNAWCEEVMSSFAPHRDPSLLTVSVWLTQEKYAAQAEHALQTWLDAVARDGVPAATLEAVKSHKRYSFLMNLENEEDVAQAVALSLNLTGHLSWMDDFDAALQAVTVEDVQAFVGKWLTSNQRTVATLHPRAAP